MAVVNFPLPPAAADSRKPAPLRLIARQETQPDTRASFFCHAADFLSFLFFSFFFFFFCLFSPQDSESLLLGSTVTIGIIAVFALCSVLVAINTCWFCKRVIVVDSNVVVDDQSAVFR